VGSVNILDKIRSLAVETWIPILLEHFNWLRVAGQNVAYPQCARVPETINKPTISLNDDNLIPSSRLADTGNEENKR